jgi:hypothetical protein
MLQALARPFIRAGLVAPDAVRQALAPLERSDAVRALDPSLRAPRYSIIDAGHRVDSETCLVEDAGLCLLWPFLERFFRQLGFTDDAAAFTDEVARHRAALVLHHAASADPTPADYRLVLAKALCGIAPEAVHALDEPITTAEAEASEALLQAVLAHCPGLGDVSVDGLRGTFLLRRGMLSTRDGCWLLRIERQPFDVLLEQLPWPMQWIPLPWMSVPMRVEW